MLTIHGALIIVYLIAVLVVKTLDSKKGVLNTHADKDDTRYLLSRLCCYWTDEPSCAVRCSCIDAVAMSDNLTTILTNVDRACKARKLIVDGNVLRISAPYFDSPVYAGINWLRMDRSTFSYISNEYFRSFGNLTSLKLHDAQILATDEGFLNVLNKTLQTLAIVQRKNTTDQIAPFDFESIASNATFEVLKSLQLNYVLLQRSLNQQLFRPFIALESLDLAQCSIEHIAAQCFDKLPSLSTLNLSGNRLKYIPGDLLVGPTAIIRLLDNPWTCDRQMCAVLECQASGRCDSDACPGFTDCPESPLLSRLRPTGHDMYYGLFALKGALALVSVVFVLATLYVYYVLKELRQTQDIVTCVMLVCLATLLFLLGMTQTTFIVRIGSFCIGFLIYFFSVAYFTWLSVIMLNVWKTTILFRWSIKEQYWYLFYHAYGWSVPTILTIVLYFNSEQHISQLSCWLIEESAFILHIPMAIILTLNLVLFGWSAFGISKTGGDVSPDRRKALKYKFLLYLRLITLSGIIWFLEILSFYYGTNTGISFWLLIDCINSLHGLGVFLVLVVFRKNIRSDLAGKPILRNWKFPNRY